MAMLLWASKFATAKIEYSLEMGNGQINTFGGTIYFAANGSLWNILFLKLPY